MATSTDAPEEHIRGDTFRVFGQFTQGDYTGWVGTSQVRDDATDALLSELEFVWLDSVQGLFMVQILSTDNWPPNKYVLFDVQVKSPGGEKRSSGAKKILVKRDVTRASV